MRAARLVAGLLAAPLPVPLGFIAWLAADQALGNGAGLAGIFLFFYLGGLAVAVTLGLPAWAVFNRMGWHSPLAYLAAGIALGAAGGTLVLNLIAGELRHGDAWGWPPLPALALFAITGMFSALLFWGIAVHRPRP
ncbi:MAG: hypothetical protein R3233_11670 [Xanthomonadales bacterium]|nr:hypothetical protein [Xanthomonadales bacterium]